MGSHERCGLSQRLDTEVFVPLTKICFVLNNLTRNMLFVCFRFTFDALSFLIHILIVCDVFLHGYLLKTRADCSWQNVVCIMSFNLKRWQISAKNLVFKYQSDNQQDGRTTINFSLCSRFLSSCIVIRAFICVIPTPHYDFPNS